MKMKGYEPPSTEKRLRGLRSTWRVVTVVCGVIASEEPAVSALFHLYNPAVKKYYYG